MEEGILRIKSEALKIDIGRALSRLKKKAPIHRRMQTVGGPYDIHTIDLAQVTNFNVGANKLKDPEYMKELQIVLSHMHNLTNITTEGIPRSEWPDWLKEIEQRAKQKAVERLTSEARTEKVTGAGGAIERRGRGRSNDPQK